MGAGESGQDKGSTRKILEEKSSAASKAARETSVNSINVDLKADIVMCIKYYELCPKMEA